jgi:uncharacterized protein YjbI with pentapeptide repeats
VPPKRPSGSASRQTPRFDGELAERSGDGLDHGEVIEDATWSGAAPPAASDVEISCARLSNVTLTGLELERWRLVDVELVECELSGTVLTEGRWERVVLRRCRLSGLVAAELRAMDTLVQDCKADGAWLRGSVLDRCELVDTDLSGADLYGAEVTRSIFRRCDLTQVDVSQSRFDQVSLHGSTVDRIKGADALRDCTIASDQVISLALPILAARGITVDDDPPDLVEP